VRERERAFEDDVNSTVSGAELWPVKASRNRQAKVPLLLQDRSAKDYLCSMTQNYRERLREMKELVDVFQTRVVDGEDVSGRVEGM
jgi:hypothetical protein